MPFGFNRFVQQIFVPSRLTFGADIKSIQFTPETVVKEFKNKPAFRQTVKFYSYITPTDTHLFPILFSVDPVPEAGVLTMSNCGSLVNLYTLPTNWENQINALRAFFLRTGILVLDIRFMPWTPYVLNNVCVKPVDTGGPGRSSRLILVDLGFYTEKPAVYINTYFDRLVRQMKVYLWLRDYPLVLYPLHLCLYFLWLLTDLFEKIQASLAQRGSME